MTVLLVTTACDEQRPAEEETSHHTPSEKTQDKTKAPLPTQKPESVAHIESIADIKKEYAHLMDLQQHQQYSISSVSYSCNGERSGNMTYYKLNDATKIIKHTFNEYSHHSGKEQYFLRNNSPFFVFKEQKSWSFDGTKNGESQTKDVITERRFYLLDNQLEKCLEKQFTQHSAREQNPSSADVPNQTMTCPTVKNVLHGFTRILQYEDKTGQIDCLENRPLE
ncbi:hypothetical protein TDB9533_03108 [Thalassocella blandensis]|nr:hypothetical protein TDB9533_03108 [Thalassocella blandensis]